jgi:nitroimidazol reductase NimA-like FMN-containing flavoprotein (pyridoxamine 5'-phosphate oxidase superfamily)
MTREQCLTRLSSQRVGRVSVSKDALPFIVPVNYRQDAAGLVLCAPLDAGFASLADRAVVAFEVDDLSPIEGGGWSVHVVGVASMLDRLGAGFESGLGQSLQLSVEQITGHQLTATAVAAPAG